MPTSFVDSYPIPIAIQVVPNSPGHNEANDQVSVVDIQVVGNQVDGDQGDDNRVDEVRVDDGRGDVPSRVAAVRADDCRVGYRVDCRVDRRLQADLLQVDRLHRVVVDRGDAFRADLPVPVVVGPVVRWVDFAESHAQRLLRMDVRQADRS